MTVVDGDTVFPMNANYELLGRWREKTGNPDLTLTVTKALDRTEKKFRHLRVPVKQSERHP